MLNSNGKYQPYVVKEIEDDAFNCADGWYIVFYAAHNDQFSSSVVIPWTVDYIGKNAFDDACVGKNQPSNSLHVVYANRVGHSYNSRFFHQKVQQDNMDWTCDSAWDTKVEITYDADKGEWIDFGDNKHGQEAMSKFVSTKNPNQVDIYAIDSLDFKLWSQNWNWFMYVSDISFRKNGVKCDLSEEQIQSEVNIHIDWLPNCTEEPNYISVDVKSDCVVIYADLDKCPEIKTDNNYTITVKWKDTVMVTQLTI